MKQKEPLTQKGQKARKASVKGKSARENGGCAGTTTIKGGKQDPSGVGSNCLSLHVKKKVGAPPEESTRHSLVNHQSKKENQAD